MRATDRNGLHRKPGALRRKLLALILASAISAPGSIPIVSDAAARRPSMTEVMMGDARRGDVKGIANSLKHGADVNGRTDGGQTPLMLAAERGHLAAVDALLKAGAKVNLLDKRRYDALTLAGALGHAAVVKRLLSAGANAKLITSPYDGTALIASAHHGHVEVVAALIKAGAPLDHVNNIGWTAVMEAIVLGDGGKRHTETLRLLLEAGANPNIPDKQGKSPLAQARQRGYTAMTKLLEKHGGKP